MIVSLLVALLCVAPAVPRSPQGPGASEDSERDDAETATAHGAAAAALERARAALEARDGPGVGAALAAALDALEELEPGASGSGTPALLFEIGALSDSAGTTDASVRAWHLACAHLTAERGAEDLRTLKARRNLGAALRRRGELVAAREQLQAVVTALERSAPDDDALLLGTRESLAICQYMLGENEAARASTEAALEVYRRTLPEDDPRVLRLVNVSAAILLQAGDLQRALERFEHVLAVRSEHLSEDDPLVLDARTNVAAVVRDLGDSRRARREFAAVLAGRERGLPPEHPALLKARMNLAAALTDLGELEQARAEYLRALDGYRASVSEDHPDRQRATLGLAAVLDDMGELVEARRLLEELLATQLRGLPPEHPQLIQTRNNLGNVLGDLGDLAGARVQAEAVLESLAKSLPEGHPELLRARRNLGIRMADLGDRSGARALFEGVLAALERVLPDDHPDFLDARASLAAIMYQQGDARGALAMQEETLSALERLFPAEHPGVLAAAEGVADSLLDTGDVEGSRALRERLLATYGAHFPPDSLPLLRTKQKLAAIRRAEGDLEGARALSEEVLAACSRSMPEGDRFLLDALCDAARSCLEVEDREAARERLGGVARSLSSLATGLALLSPRERGEVASGLRHAVALAARADGADGTRAAFAALETLRASVAAPGAIPERTADLVSKRERLRVVREELSALVAAGADEERAQGELEAEIAARTTERDRLERALRRDAGERPRVSVDARALGASLPEGTAAIGFASMPRVERSEESGRILYGEDALLAHVVLPGGALRRVELGPVAELTELAERWREGLGRPLAARGVALGGSPGDEAAELEVGRELRRRLLDPVVAVAGAANVLHVCLDDFLYVLPLEALPLEEGRVGDRFRVVDEPSFARLVHPADDGRAGETGGLLVLGGAAFDAQEPPLDPGAYASPPIQLGLRGSDAPGFAPLPGTLEEARALADLYRAAFGEEPLLLAGAAASKRALRAGAEGARFLHVATHGWFAAEPAASGGAGRAPGGSSELGVARGAAAGLAPMVLCGLALAGANGGRDASGGVPGLITAEELAGLDLSACRLAVLSACETNVGVRAAGRGIQSLRTALHAAGARTTVTSLWRVDDAATKRLMERFYTELWIEGAGPAEALWRAKRALRDDGAPTRDWAAWILSGDPR